MPRPSTTFVAIACLAIALSLSLAKAAEDPLPNVASTSPEIISNEVAATVDGEAILVSEVEQSVLNALQGRPVNPSARKEMQAEVLAQLIDRKLIQKLLEKSGRAPTDAEIDQAFAMIKAQAAEKKIDFEKMLSQGKISEQQLREQIAWQLGWGKFVERELTDARLKAYFDAYQKEFDGTELKVSHIVLRPDGPDSPAETMKLKELAGRLREQIVSGKMSFEDAAEKYSSGPSRRKGGDLGYTPRRGLMMEPFAATAFQLKEGEISEPVLTAYGLHLIKVTGKKPGTKIWADSREQLKGPATQELFEETAARARSDAKIEFTGKLPHYKPGTKELSEP